MFSSPWPPGSAASPSARLVLALALLIGCSARPPLRPLAAGERATAPAAGLGHARHVARGPLTYAVAFVDPDTIVSVELGVEFELVVRDLVPRLRERWRARLGPADYDVAAMAVDARGERVFVASRDGTVRGFELATGTVAITWHLGAPATAVAVSPDGRHVATGDADGAMCLRRQRDGALLHCVVAHAGQISSLAMDATGTLLASASWTGEVVIWRVPSLAIAGRHVFSGAACDLAFSPDAGRLAVARSAHAPVRSPEVAEQERSGGHDRPHPWHAVSVWDLNARRVVHLTGHGGPVTSVAWMPDGARLLSGSWDRTVRMWDTARGVEIARHLGVSGLVRDVAVAMDGRRALVGAWTRSLHGRSLVLLALLYPEHESRTTEHSGD